MGDPSSCDTPTAAGSEFSTMSGLREAKFGGKKVIIGMSYDLERLMADSILDLKQHVSLQMCYVSLWLTSLLK